MSVKSIKTDITPKLAIFEAIPAIMSEMGHIGKDKRGHNFNFRGIDDVYNHLQKLLAKYGVFTTPSVLEDRTEERTTSKGAKLIYRVLKIHYTFWASDGSCVEATVMGEGMDSGDKASNKAMSVAHKYAFFQVFAIPTEELVDPDTDQQHPESEAEYPPIANIAAHRDKFNEMVEKDLSLPIAKRDEIFDKLVAEKCKLNDVKRRTLELAT